MDKDTVVLIDRSDTLATLGSGMITFFDGRATVSDYFARADGEVLSVTGSSLTVSESGHRLDLTAHQEVDIAD